MHFKSDTYIFMKTGCLTKSFLKIDGGGRSYVHSRGVAKCIWYNDKLWSGVVYNLYNSTVPTSWRVHSVLKYILHRCRNSTKKTQQ